MEGAIEVAAVFEAPNKVLHIFLQRTEPLGDELSALFREKAAEYLAGGDFKRGEFNFGRKVEQHWYGAGSSPRDGFRGWLDPPGVRGYEQGFLYPEVGRR